MVSSQKKNPRFERFLYLLDAKHRRDKCMDCSAKPDYEVSWAEGMAHAWFCEKHLKEWLKASVASCAEEGFSNKNCELNSIKKLDAKEASKKFGDNKNPNIIDYFLSKIPMPEVNKEKKKELEEESKVVVSKPIGVNDAEDLAPVGPSGKERGKELALAEVLSYFKSFYIAKPYVSLVGGLVTNGKTKGDIDVYIARKERDKVTEFRISRMLPEELASRVHFLYPDEDEATEGVYTNNIELYDLKLERKEEKKIELMSIEDAIDKVELFKFCKLLKPAHGRFKGELYTIDNLMELMSKKPEWYEKGIYVQKKFDGVHVRCDVQHHYESGFSVRIWTEEGNEISSKLPTLVEALGKASKGYAMALVGELEVWKDKKHQSRQQTTAIIHTKDVHPDEGKVILNVFDIIFYNKEDIHKKPYSERLKLVRSRIGVSEKSIRVAETSLEGNAEYLRKGVGRFAAMPGSEGAYLKRADFPYELDGKTNLNIKYKNTFSIDAEVKDIHNVSGAESWNYLCTIRDGKRDVPIGRTYNTSIKLKEGDIVKVEFVNLNKYFDVKLKRGWYNWWSPRVIMARRDKKRPDNVDTADQLVKASNGEIKNRRASIALDGDPYMTLPTEDKKILGMAHMHVRGKSVHIDLRFGVAKDWAVGWTLYIPKGLSKVPETFTEAKTLVDKEIMPIVIEKLKDPTQKFNCGTKAVEPIEWLDYQGRVEKGEVGATKNEPGYFYIIDRFDARLGTQKANYHEYFCDGKIFNGRFCVRLLENKEEWKKTGEGVMTWMASTALTDKTPYVLGMRAITKKWVPPYGHSALPENIRSKVPEEYQYWNSRDPKKRLEIRVSLIEEIKKTRIRIDALGPVSYKVLKQTFKKQTVIREGPTRTRYFFVICKDGMQKLSLAFINNPLEQNELTGIKTKDVKLCEYKGHENDVKPGTELNKTKATPSNMEVLEEGKAIALVDRAVKEYKLKDGKMKGNWILYNEEEGSAMWVLERIVRAS